MYSSHVAALGFVEAQGNHGFNNQYLSMRVFNKVSYYSVYGDGKWELLHMPSSDSYSAVERKMAF